MANVLLKVKEFCIKYKKRMIKVTGISFLVIAIFTGGIFGIIYSKASANIKYDQDKLQQIALEKVPGEVVSVERRLNFRQEAFEYDFKIKDKENMLQEVKVDSRYGVILGMNRQKNNVKNKNDNKAVNDKHKNRAGKQ
jgi:Na+-translocating ferredoxin:NAD+ oxidoreductase RnfG subunit